MATLLPIALDQTGVISVAGIVVAGVLGPATVATFARCRQKGDQSHERRLKRYDDLATLLDDAAAQLAPGASYLRKAAAGGGPSATELGEWSSRVHSTYERLLLRLPETDPVCQRFDIARQWLREVARSIADGDSAETESTIRTFEQARSAFLASARTKLDQSIT